MQATKNATLAQLFACLEPGNSDQTIIAANAGLSNPFAAIRRNCIRVCRLHSLAAYRSALNLSFACMSCSYELLLEAARECGRTNKRSFAKVGGLAFPDTTFIHPLWRF